MEKKRIISGALCALAFIGSVLLGSVIVKNGNYDEAGDFEELNAPSRGSIGGFDLNTATKDTLMSIKGIGEVYSENIIEQREKMGGFTYVDDLLYVKGIGIKRLEAIKPYVKTD